MIAGPAVPEPAIFLWRRATRLNKRMIPPGKAKWGTPAAKFPKARPSSNFLAGPALQTGPEFLFLTRGPGEDLPALVAQGKL
jgi:hypothetical protein